jgi:SHS2 domain-containing protein
VDVDDVELTGAVPKAIALHELSFQERPDGDWSCQVTIDI